MRNTDRLIIRKARPEDTNEILDFINSDFVMKYNTYDAYNEAKLWKVVEQGFNYVLVLKETEKIIGLVGIENDFLRYNVDSVALNYMLHENYTHQGYMREALREIVEEIFDVMKKPLISLRIATENKASIKLAEALGFHYDGTIRLGTKKYNNKCFDDAIYSMTSQEFEENLSF